MPIDVYISANGNSRIGQQNPTTEKIINQNNEQEELEVGQEGVANAAAPAGMIANAKGFISATAKVIGVATIAVAATQKIVNQALTEYADLSGNVMIANQRKSEINLSALNFIEITKNVYNDFKTLQKEKARIDFIKQRSGNSVLDGSRWSES